MTPEALYHDAFFTQFYDIDNGWSPDRSYCLNLARDRASVLDLGCGTGSLAAEIAKHVPRVVGVDPASGMLDVARNRPGGERVRWIEGDARSVRIGETFDFICMTGHAFQCLLSRDDRVAFVRTLAAHLEPEGCFIFDSRNPAHEEWREWTPEQSRRTIQHPVLGDVDVWDDVAFDPPTQIVTYGTTYAVRSTGKTRRTESRIAFPARAELDALIAQNGLRVDRWLGDWDGSAWHQAAPEIIPLGGLAAASR